MNIVLTEYPKTDTKLMVNKNLDVMIVIDTFTKNSERVYISRNEKNKIF